MKLKNEIFLLVLKINFKIIINFDKKEPTKIKKEQN